jgi:hypothetical protein
MQSPGMGGQGSPQSPAMNGESTFTGDKRSYKLVSEIAKQIAGVSGRGGSADAGVHQGEDCSYLGADVAAEKCSLLVSMLHHQLKQVRHRSSDPSQSRVTNRDIRSSRLTPKNMIELLRNIVSAYVMLTDGLSVRPPAFFKIQEYQATKEYWLQSKRNIMLRLLTAQLLLFQTLETSYLQDGPVPSSNDVYMSTFRIVVQTLREEFQEGNSDSLLGEFFEKSACGPRASSATDASAYMRGRLSSSQAIMQVCFRLLKCITPRDLSSVRISDYEEWQGETDSSGIVHLLLSALHEMCEHERGQANVAAEHTYVKLDEALRLNMGRKGTAGDGSTSSRFGVNPLLVKQTKSVSWWALQCVLDFILYEGTNPTGLLFSSLLSGGLLDVLGSSAVFREMKSVLCESSTLPQHAIAAYMGYNGITGSISSLATAWTKVVQIYQCAVRYVRKSTSFYCMSCLHVPFMLA